MDGNVENGGVDVSSGYIFENSHTLSQCEDSSTFKDMDGYFEFFYGDVSCGYVFFKQPHSLPMWISKYL